MVWAPFNWMFGMQKPKKPGMEAFFDENKAFIMQWVDNSPTHKYIVEILRHLCTAQGEQPGIGPLWRVSGLQKDVNPHLSEVLRFFDYLIRTGVTPADHLNLTTLLCQDVELGPPEDFKGSWSSQLLKEVEFIKDPCLKFFAKYITSSDVESISFDFWDVNSSFRDSWARIAKHLIYQYHAADTPYVLQLQSVVWPTISDEEAGLCKRALTDPTALAHLQRIFEYPIACQHHHDHGGHLFLHLFQKGPELTIPVDIKTYPGVSLEGRLMNFGLFYLLLTSIGPENLALGISSANVSSDCLAQIIEICKAIQASPSSLFGLLCDFTDAIIDRGVCSEELIAISICVNKAFDQPRDPRATPLILPLIKSILRVRDTMLSMQYRSPEENELASTNAMKVIDRLYAYLASTMLFNGQSSRNLSCARALKTCNQVAIGWLPPYE